MSNPPGRQPYAVHAISDRRPPWWWRLRRTATTVIRSILARVRRR